MNENLAVGTVVILKNGKAEDRWQITSPMTPAVEGGMGATYGARRWIKKNAKWSGTSYLISPNQIIRVEGIPMRNMRDLDKLMGW